MKHYMGLMGIFCAVIQAFSNTVVVPIPVSVPGNGFISLSLLDTSGVTIRTLAYAEAIGAAGRTYFWDGTTDIGLPAAPGEYRTRGVFFTNGPTAKFVMKVGSSGNPPWRLRDGTGDWGGDLGGPSAIVANNTSLVVTWSAVEGNTLPGIQQIDTNGDVLRSLTSFYPWDGRMAGAMDDQHLFLGILNRDAQRMEIARYELGSSNKAILALLPTPPHFTRSGRWKNRWQSMLDGMAITSTRIYATVSLDDRLYIIDRNNGAILSQISIPSPRGIAVQGGRLLAVSSNHVIAVSFTGTVEGTLVTGSPLQDPYAIAVDRSGNFYVSDGGSQQTDPEAVTGNHQVHVFNSSGAHLRSLGAPGGSPRSGAYVRQAFGDVQSLCIGPDNKLWVNEEITGFKRTSRWNTNGVIEKEWFQRKLTHYADLHTPGRPNELIYMGRGFDDFQGLTAYSFDLSTGNWQPSWSYAQKQEEMYQEDVFLSNDHAHPLQEYQPGRRYPSFQYDGYELVTYNGRHYFLNAEGNGDGAVFVYSPTNKPRAVAMIGYHRVDIVTNRIVSYYDSGPNRWFTWADSDGNGHMALAECTLTENLARLALSGRIIRAKLETNLSVRMLRRIGPGVQVESVLPLKQLLANGAPVYDWSMLQDLTMHQLPSFAGGDFTKPVTTVNNEVMPIDAGGFAYALLTPETDADLNLPSLDHFWADRNWRKKIVKFERATGKTMWSVGRRAPGRARNGEMYNPFGISISHNTVFAADVLGMVWLWSSDGLYLGRLLHDAEPGRTWDEYALHAEVQGPVTLFTNSTTGKLYMVANDTGAHIYEVGLPRLQSLTQTAIQLTAAQSSAADPWDPDNLPPLAGSSLSARLLGLNVQLWWHTNAGGLLLQGAQNPTGTWNTVTAPRSTNGATVSVTVPKANPQGYYRLRQ